MISTLIDGMAIALHTTVVGSVLHLWLMPFERSLDDGDTKFYALPQPALPPKDVTDPAPEVYTPPGRDA